MNILAIETSTQACSAALLCNGEIRQRYQVAPRGHGDLILPMVDELMSEAGLSPAQLGAVAFGRGPGAFTGVRIATSVAQGIAFAADLPVVPVSSLAALAQAGFRHKGYQAMLCAVDARMDEVYWGAYQIEQGVVSLLSDECVCRPELVPALPEVDVQWHGMGNGWDVYADSLTDRFSLPTVADDVAWLARAEEVAVLAQHALERGETVSAEQAMPVYLRDNVAIKSKKITEA
ncbi:MAG TPA: tRNA (adenosine(37)-N6)-threonylcarbamoyltransferase complex dimerization subunit type 1 TsaB [Candidatus Tenderia electrophaga]|uniref:tRNA threonylcarbamoyladenosine biosynthesis protein TsaB n=1 Tax=Candidatus Tenderia electrophaga TaxID=1748243 RepID=A0A832J3R2_9GAMM|nr:tRNA (adenosine(37)-N6)-threonylcarbamoyltransferase complex dimerization subunit type 1 TsaB [Candidatus Tenderia electrophaga]